MKHMDSLNMNLSQNRLSQKFKTSGFSRLRYIPYRVPFDVVCFGKRHGPYRAVKGAVRRVNKWLKRNEQFSQEGSFDDIITDAPFQPPKVLLRVRTRCSRKLQENTSPGTSLKNYLSLPVSEYCLLDPRWIQLSPTKDSTFRVTIPIQDLLAIDMGPVIADVKVRQDPVRENVTFFIEGVTFGRPDLDELMSIRLRLFLFASDNRRRNWLPFRRWRNSPEVDTFIDDFQDLQRIKSAGVPLPRLNTDLEDGNESDFYASCETIQIHPEAESGKESDELDDETIELSDGAFDEDDIWLNCSLQLRLNVALPPVLAFIPKIIIVSAGRIILRHIVNRALPNFIDMVADDYQAWASGSLRGIYKNRELFPLQDEEEQS